MERFSQRENVLLGYSPQRALANLSSSPKPPFSHQNIDFNDVFGGPPRRSSMQEVHHSLSEPMSSTREEVDSVLPLSPWTGLNEMPVFGEETVNRRRYPSDDFFDDIFRGEEPVLGSPRRSNQDPFGSTASSRVMSPARPLTPRADPFSSSLPAQFQFSLPAKLTKTMDFPVSASSSRSPYKHKDPTSSPSLSKLSSEVIREEDDELRNETLPSYRPSPLSHESSLSSKESSHVMKSGDLESKETGENLKKDLKTADAPINSSQFHFSIYKWASKGVPLLMPIRGGNSVKYKERIKTGRCSSSNGRIESDNVANGLQTVNWLDSDLHFVNQNESANDETPCTEDRGSLTKTSTEDGVEPCHAIKEEVISMPESKSINKIPNTVKNVPGDAILIDKREEIKPNSQSETGFCGSTDRGIPMRGQEAKKPELMPLHSLLNDTDDGQGNDEISIKFEGKDMLKSETGFCGSTDKGIPMRDQEAKKPELMPLHSLLNDTDDGQGNDEISIKFEGKGMPKKTNVSDSNANVGKNAKKREEKRTKSHRTEVFQESEPHSQDSHKTSGDNVGLKRANGKVKAFVKIFSQEATSQPKFGAETRSQSCRWKGKGTFSANNEGSESCQWKSKGTIVADYEGSANTPQINNKNHVHKVNKMKTPPKAPVKVDKNFEEPEKQQSQSKTRVFSASENSFGQQDTSASCSESFPDGIIDDLFEENFVIKELPNDQEKLLQTSNGYEDIKTSDAKIRQWSNGKEGNIRSLLSTLQYVLWPGSGWKPVPLMDIIEGSAVKKAYQKALLCLHPDKLQQKGAASHQKYIAAKVFEVLQEAWDHFSSLGAI